MNDAVKTSLGLCLMLLSTACGGAGSSASGSSLLEDRKAAMREITAILVTMQDEASAEAAADELTELIGRVRSIREREKALSPHEYLVMTEGDTELEGLRGALRKETMRLATDEELSPYVDDAYSLLDQ